MVEIVSDDLRRKQGREMQEETKALLEGKTIRRQKRLSNAQWWADHGYNLHSSRAGDGNGFICWVDKERR